MRRSSPLRNRSRRALFLCYHSIAEPGPSYLSIPPAAFERHLELLRAGGWRSGTLGTLRALASGRRVAGRHAFLTFDDGYRDNLTVALPRLCAHAFRGFVFVLPPYVARSAPLAWPEVAQEARRFPDVMRSLDWGEVEQLAEAGCEIGSHGLHHLHLPALADEPLREELLDSRRRIAERLGRCDMVAYPFGEWSGRVAAAARDAGYEFGFTLPFGHQLRAGMTSIPRVAMDHRDDARRLAAKTSGMGRSLLFSPLRPTVRRLRRG